MTEAELLREITGLADELGIFWHHETRAHRGPRGWVDLILVGDRGALFAELKSSGGRRTRDQIRVAARLELAGLEYRLWTPADWYQDTVREELTQISLEACTSRTGVLPRQGPLSPSSSGRGASLIL